MRVQDLGGSIIGAASGGAMMIETERLFNSLNGATEFTVTEDHLKLLRHTSDLYWDPGEGYGAPFINPKKPYGTSNVLQDVTEIVGGARQRLGMARRGSAHAPARAARGPAREARQVPAGRGRGSLPAPARGGRNSARDRIGHWRVPARPLHTFEPLEPPLEARLIRPPCLPLPS